jgi:hypothetical protein
MAQLEGLRSLALRLLLLNLLLEYLYHRRYVNLRDFIFVFWISLFRVCVV